MEDDVCEGTCGQCSHCLRLRRINGPELYVCVADVGWGDDAYEVNPDDAVSTDDCCQFDPTRVVE